jgi:hypothetical protein
VLCAWWGRGHKERLGLIYVKGKCGEREKQLQQGPKVLDYLAGKKSEKEHVLSVQIVNMMILIITLNRCYLIY